MLNVNPAGAADGNAQSLRLPPAREVGHLPGRHIVDGRVEELVMSIPYRVWACNPARRLMSVAMQSFLISTAFLIPASASGQTVPQSSVTKPPATPTTVEAAHEKLVHGHEQEAIDALQALAAAEPPAPGANRELGIAYYRTGKLVEADKSFAAAMTEDPRDAESVQMRGLTQFRLGQMAAAIPYLERTKLLAQASDVDVNYVLGRCYIGSHRYDDARTAFGAQYGLDPESGAPYLLNSQMLLREEMPEIAEQNAQKALQRAPAIALAHFALGKIYMARGDFAHALEQFEQERAINPTYPPLYQFLGDLYTRLNRRQKAQHALTEALSLDQSSTGPFILMGKLFLEDNDPQTAASYLEHAEQMDPSNFIIHNLLAQAYRQMGKKDDAKREFNAVSKIHAAENESPR